MHVDKEGPNAVCRCIRGISSSVQEFPALLLARGFHRIAEDVNRPFMVNGLAGLRVRVVSQIGT